MGVTPLGKGDASARRIARIVEEVQPLFEPGLALLNLVCEREQIERVLGEHQASGPPGRCAASTASSPVARVSQSVYAWLMAMSWSWIQPLRVKLTSLSRNSSTAGWPLIYAVPCSR